MPVNVYVVAPAAVVITYAMCPPMPGMVSISLLLNEPAGATVEVQDAMGADVEMSLLEEAVRRGATLGLPGYGPYGRRTQAHHRSRAHHADSELRGDSRQLLLSLTSMDGSSLTCVV